MNGKVTEYTVIGGRIIQEKWPGTKEYYSYTPDKKDIDKMTGADGGTVIMSVVPGTGGSAGDNWYGTNPPVEPEVDKKPPVTEPPPTGSGDDNWYGTNPPVDPGGGKTNPGRELPPIRGAIYFSVYNAPTSYKNTLTFLYDADGTLSGFIDFNGKYNYYGRNAQGDITEIYSEDSVLLCKYVYDSWGKLVSVKDASGVDKTADASFIGNVNPFRYRGYYYDRETGLYYLNSRYYDPETGRFINADVLIDSGHELLGHNLFAYCNNNPVNKSDPSGMAPGDAFKNANKAAIDFGQNYNGVSIDENKEYISLIYSFKEKKRFLGFEWEVERFSYTEPDVGSTNRARIPSDDILLNDQTKAAIIHTHSAYNGTNDVFSELDKGAAKQHGVPIYLVTPRGQLRRYDPNEATWFKKDTLISNKMPYDLNYPKK